MHRFFASQILRRFGLIILCGNLVFSQLAASEINFSHQVQPILVKYCLGCHGEKDNETDIQLHSISAILAAGPHGPIVVPKDANASKLMQLVQGTHEPKMPPADSPQPSPDEIAILRQWIEQGAKGTDEMSPLSSRLKVKPIAPSSKTKDSISAIGAVGKNVLLLGKYGSVHLSQDRWNQLLPIELVGKITQIRTTPNARFSSIVGGIPGLGGQVTIIEHSPQLHAPKVIQVIEGHKDSLFSGVLNQDGTLLATAGYDRQIMLWELPSGRLLKTLTGHNGAIYDLDFDASGKILASASADETIKIWNVETGERLDTFGQCEAEQYSVRFAPDGDRVFAAGADRRVRVWKLLSKERPSVSPMLHSVFAHEAAINYLAISQDGRFVATASEDKQIKLWETQEMRPLGILGTLEDYPSGLVWNSDQASLTVSSVAGKVTRLDVSARQLAPDIKSESGIDAPLVTTGQINLIAPQSTIIDEQHTPHSLSSPQQLPPDSQINGILRSEDASGEFGGDWFVFTTKAREPWLLEIDASRSGSPMDSQIDVLTVKGEPILRTRLQAVRESYFTFRGKDSTNIDDFRMHRWEDMELNELLYAGGEVVKLWLYPRGPDSGFKTYPGFGTRFTYFDTTATTHALNEPAWIVRQLASGEPPVPNGLPVFPIYYSNDDAGNRLLGKDSQITFVSETDGQFLVRVRDTRGQSGDEYKYKLTLRHPTPKFVFRMEQKDITLRPGVGTEFSVVVDRLEGCDGDIQIDFTGLPDGLQMTNPLVIEAGQHRAIGTIQSPRESKNIQEFKLQAKAHSKLNDQTIDNKEPLELLVKLSEKPAMNVKVVARGMGADAVPLTELVIHPGETISANVVIERGDLQGDIAFGGDDSGRNLPHGCYVDNIGLSGLLIPAGQSVREFFITASPVAREQTRSFHLRANVDGNPTTAPIQIRVAKPQ